MYKLRPVPPPRQHAGGPVRGNRQPGLALAMSLLLHGVVLGLLFAIPRPDSTHRAPSSNPFTLHFPNSEPGLAEMPDSPDSSAPAKPTRKAVKGFAHGPVVVPNRTLAIPPITLPEPAGNTTGLLSQVFDSSMDFPHAEPDRAEPGNQSKPPTRQASGLAKATVAARPLKTQAPIYPNLALERRYQGTSVFIATIKASGMVESLHLSKTSGHPILDQAAENALRHWKFAPATHNGIAIDSQLRIPIVFRLG